MAEAAPACTIRIARACDDERIVALGAQLGYAIEAVALEAMRARADSEQVLLVAEAGRSVVGWSLVAVRRLLMHPVHAEVEGLVVEEHARGHGVGPVAPACRRGLGRMVVGSGLPSACACSVRRGGRPCVLPPLRL